MDINEATILKAKNLHLIGKKDKGATIDELILIPTNSDLADKFLQIYLRILDGEKAIIPFAGSDVYIVAVFDKKRISGQNFFFHTDILNLPDELGVITE